MRDAGAAAFKLNDEKMRKAGQNMTTERLIDKEVEYVLAALMPSNALVCQVSLHTGLRVSDVLALKTAQLAPRFWVTEQKTGKRKQIGLPAPLLESIKAQAGDVWAFPGRFGDKPLTRQAIWKDVKRAAAAFRIPRNIAPHSFRKVYAADVLAAYGDLKKVQKALNHSSELISMLYIIGARNLLDKQASMAYYGVARYGRRGKTHHENA